MKLLIHLYRSGLIIIAFLFTILSVMYISAGVYNIIISEKVITFINKATLEEETANTRYYVINEVDFGGKTITKDKIPLLGSDGDIFIMPVSYMDILPLVAEFISFNIGGHAGLIVDEGKKTVEAMGGTLEEAYVFTAKTDLYTEGRSIIGLRVKASIEERKKAAEYSKSLVGMDYSYWYLSDLKNKYYCTNLCSRVYGKENNLFYNLDANGFIRKTQDLILSKNTFITFVKTHKDGKTNIYYLKEK